MLKIVNLSKTYSKGVKAVDNISLEIRAGDIFGFVGPNGAGKTTAIKCVTNILDFEEGDILIDGMSVKEKPMECKKITAYVPDNPDLYDSMTGIKYLNFIADIFRLNREDRESRIEKYSDAFDMTKHLGDPISSYSHGMKQKIAVMSALIHEPKLIVLDEPFVGLDPRASHIMKEYLKEFCNRGSAVFFSTHVLEVVEKFCNRIAIIKNGKIALSGETKEIIKNKSLESLFLELVEKWWGI